MTSGPRPILWDIYEEHLDEAAFLWGQWERASLAPNQTIDEVIAGPEERLLAHLDGLVLGGKPVAERLLVPALDDDDSGKVFAAAWALVQAEDADHLALVLSKLAGAKPPARTALGRALELSTRADLARQLAAVWATSETPVRAVLFEAIAIRDDKWAKERLPECLAEGSPLFEAAALRSLRRAPERALDPFVQQALRSPDSAVRAEAIATGFVLGLSVVHEACKREAQRTDDACRLPLALLAVTGTPDGRDYLRARLGAEDVRRHVLWALGFAGDLEAADAMLAALDDEKVARTAGEALAAITGLVIAGPLAKPAVPKGPGTEDVAPDDPVPEALPEDVLPLPAAEAVRKWWREKRSSFHPGARYAFAEIRGERTALATLRRAAMWRRQILCLEWASTRRAPVREHGWLRQRV